MAKRSMQPLMFPDWFDGNKTPKTLEEEIAVSVLSLHHLVVQPHYDRIGTLQLEEEYLYDNPEVSGAYGALNKLIKTDSTFKSLMGVHNEYKENPKNYIVSKELTKALKRTKLDIKKKHIPRQFRGYLEVPNIEDQYGDQIRGAFISSKTWDSGHQVLSIGYVVNPSLMVYGFIRLPLYDYDDETSLEDIFKDYHSVITRPNEDKSAVITEKTDSVFSEGPKTLVNTMLYITASNADLVEEVNQFDKKKSKKVVQEKLYTKKPYTFVGRNFQMPRSSYELSCGEFSVTGHWRYQPHGPGMTQRKWIFIEEYLKRRQ